MTKLRINPTAGRPKAIIDWDKVDMLLESGCLTTEIAAHLGISTDCLAQRCVADKKVNFSAYKQEKKHKGESLLRDAQFKKAMTGDNSMLIWLGKQRLEQRDKPKEDQEEDDFVKKLAQALSVLGKVPDTSESSGSEMET